jgi:hypothetical protein
MIPAMGKQKWEGLSSELTGLWTYGSLLLGVFVLAVGILQLRASPDAFSLIVLKARSPLGRRIIFMPPFRWFVAPGVRVHPVVGELRRLVAEAASEE